MFLFEDIFTNKECIRLKNYIYVNEGMFYTKYNFKKLGSSDNSLNLNTYNKTYSSIHFLEKYNKIIDLIKKINTNVKQINQNLKINDIFIKKWGGYDINFEEDSEKNLTLFTKNNSIIKSINYQFHNYFAIFFNETCQLFYDKIDSFKFDKSVICPRGSVLFLEKEHFIIKNVSLMYSLALGYSNEKSNITNIILNKNIYKDVELL